MVINDDLNRLVSENADVQAFIQGLDEVITLLRGPVDVWDI